MLNAFWWFLTAEAIGLAAFPLAFYLFPRLTDRGFSVSKPLGILIIGYVSWILSALHILPSVRVTLILLLLLMGGLSAWYAWKKRVELREFVVRERGALIAAELVFIAFFVGWAIFRATSPFINHTEQPMDFAFLNASILSGTGQPEDPWLRGETISYYYFGYWMMGGITEITGLPSAVSYNLSLALIPAMGAMGIFGLLYSMIRSEAGRLRWAIAGGVAAALFLGVVSNLMGVLEFMRANSIGSQAFYDWLRIDGLDGPTPAPAQSWTPSDFWWWFRATRVINTFDGSSGIDYTIQEFPAFSFVLGDLHPHVMSIPFALLFIGIAWNFFRSPTLDWHKRDLWGYASLFMMALVLGGLAFTNIWDLPTYGALFLGVATLKAYRERGGDAWKMVTDVASAGALVIGVAILLYVPYYATFNSSVAGFQAVTTTTRPVHMLIIWALFLVAVTPMIVHSFWQATASGASWRTPVAIVGAVAAVPYLAWAFQFLESGGLTGDLSRRVFQILPFAILIGMAVYGALWTVRRRGPNGKAFALALSALGLTLIMGPELLYVDDSFGPPSERMNTVFKLYYQAWLLLAAASGFAIYYWRSLRVEARAYLQDMAHSSPSFGGVYTERSRSAQDRSSSPPQAERPESLPPMGEGQEGGKSALPQNRHILLTRLLTTLWAGVFVALLAGSAFYAPAAIVSKGELPAREATLDGLSFVSRSRPAEYEAIEFLKRDASPDSALVEAVGEWFDAGLISRSTGIPTVFNWPGHQIQWRGSPEAFDGREQDVATIYQTQDIETARNLLEKYDVEYVYVGPRERDKYGTEGLDKFAAFMEMPFDQDDVAIYKLAP